MANWFAQSDGNVNADIWYDAPLGGNLKYWSNITSDEVLCTNGHEITVNVDIKTSTGDAIARITNKEIDFSTSSGSFNISGTTAINIKATTIDAGSSALLYCTHTGQIDTEHTDGLYITTGIGEDQGIIGGTGIGVPCVMNTSTGDITVVSGNVKGGFFTSVGIYNVSTGSITITGDIIGGNISDANGAYNASTGSITITGDVIGGSDGDVYGILNYDIGDIIVVSGNVIGGSFREAYGILNHSIGSITIESGNVIGGSGIKAYGILNYDIGDITIENCNLLFTSDASDYYPMPIAGNMVNLTLSGGNDQYIEMMSGGSKIKFYKETRQLIFNRNRR